MIQNSDIKVRLTLQDSEANPYVINDLNDYEVYVYNKPTGENKKLLATYRKDDTGAYAIDVYDSANGKIDIVINRQLTRFIPDGKLYAEVRVQLNAGSEFINSLQNAGANGVLIDTMVSSANPNSLK